MREILFNVTRHSWGTDRVCVTFLKRFILLVKYSTSWPDHGLDHFHTSVLQCLSPERTHLTWKHRQRDSPATAERSNYPPVMKRLSGREKKKVVRSADQKWCVWPSQTQMRTQRTPGWKERHSWMDRRLGGWTDPVRTDRAAALTEMNESLKRRVSGNIRSGAAGVPDTLLPLTGLLLHAAASPHWGRTAASSGRKR